mmetsp:Transcript_26792/g.77981  ORF Transcript_26792/g.77981 Transcript_26792/m.77981 type:complete len:86 (+) Transcript_26792:502-759(+)
MRPCSNPADGGGRYAVAQRPQQEPQYLFSPGLIWYADLDLPVQATRTPKCWLDGVGAVRSRKHNHPSTVAAVCSWYAVSSSGDAI